MIESRSVDIYCRTAADDRETTTKLATQEGACRAYCEAQGLQIGAIYRETAVGTTYDTRTELAHILRHCRKGLSGGVVVVSSDRISRLVEQRIVFEAELACYHATLYVLQEESAWH